jgi:hypothetical protein
MSKGVIFKGIIVLFLLLETFHIIKKTFLPKLPSPLEKGIQEIEKYEYIFDYLYHILMAILLIYLFNPMRKKQMYLDDETRVLLFSYGIILAVSFSRKFYITHKNKHKILNKNKNANKQPR